MESIEDFVSNANRKKILFTPGPASLLSENIEGLSHCFGRGDSEYDAIETRVLDKLKSMSGHYHIARMQGSGSLALEINSLNFLYGKVLIINTGYYSDRLKYLAISAKENSAQITHVDSVHWQNLDTVSGNYDWVWACPTETSAGLKLPISSLALFCKKIKSKLMLDATASIGLELNHELADVISYSSCKGLFGLTGAAFISFNTAPVYEPNSFYLNLKNHLEKKMTGPYHAILSLKNVLERHAEIRESVVINKRIFLERIKHLTDIPDENQPLLCTYLKANIKSNNPSVIIYSPRSNIKGSIICHLGEVHHGPNAKGNILDELIIEEYDENNG